jgi:hypothetical protein
MLITKKLAKMVADQKAGIEETPVLSCERQNEVQQKRAEEIHRLGWAAYKETYMN